MRATVPPAEYNGGIGYWDADSGSYAGSTTACQAVTGVTSPCGVYDGPIKFNGVVPSRITMHDGIYDNFWTINRMYVSSNLGSQGGGVYLEMFNNIVTYLNNPTNVTTALASGNKGLFYGAAVELNFNKTSSKTYPRTYKASTDAATPN